MLTKKEITNSNEENLSGILLDSKLNVKIHISFLCRKAGQEINTLVMLKNHFTSNQRNLPLKSVITSHFTYCPLIRMFKSCYINML